MQELFSMSVFARPAHELSNRCIERHVLAPVGISHTELQATATKYSDLSVLTDKPFVGLLFVAPGMYWGREENHKLEQEVTSAYGQHFFDKLIAVGCNECLTEEPEELRSCEGPRGPATGTPGLLFWPASDGMQVRVSHDDVTQYQFTGPEQNNQVAGYIEDLVAELGLDDGDDSALLVFANSFPPFIPATACLFDAIQSRCKGKKTSVWGGCFNDDVSITNNVGVGFMKTDAWFVLIRLSGPGLDSASTVIRCGKSRPEVDEQLRQFKSKLTLKRHSVLLMSGPVEIEGGGGDGYASCGEFKAAALRIFDEPGIQVLGAFSNIPHAIGVESWNHGDNDEQRYLWYNCMSVMMLTYD